MENNRSTFRWSIGFVLAAASSAVSVMEAVVASFMDKFHISRTKACNIKGIITLFFGFLIFFGFASCCEDELPPTSVGLGTQVFSDSSFSAGSSLKGIVVSLRNDSVSEKPLKTATTTIDGLVDFIFAENEPYKDWYVVSTEEITKIRSEETEFYMIVNDPACTGYNRTYETKILRWNTKGAAKANQYIVLNKL